MTDTQPPITKLDSAFDGFVALPETDAEAGRMLAETAAALEEVRTDITEQLLPDIDEALDAAAAILEEGEREEQEKNDSERVEDLRGQLAELD